MITLRTLVDAQPERFHPQTWYLGEAFLDVELPEDVPPRSPSRLSHIGAVPPQVAPMLPLAVTLVAAYLRRPFDPIWARYLWCRDKDAQGQRIYVGGVTDANGRKFEIHRHLAITAQWGVPEWE